MLICSYFQVYDIIGNATIKKITAIFYAQISLLNKN